MAHMVHCVKLKKDMPGLDEPPFDNELGQKVYDHVSQEAMIFLTMARPNPVPLARVVT